MLPGRSFAVCYKTFVGLIGKTVVIKNKNQRFQIKIAYPDSAVLCLQCQLVLNDLGGFV